VARNLCLASRVVALRPSRTILATRRVRSLHDKMPIKLASSRGGTDPDLGGKAEQETGMLCWRLYDTCSSGLLTLRRHQ